LSGKLTVQNAISSSSNFPAKRKLLHLAHYPSIMSSPSSDAIAALQVCKDILGALKIGGLEGKKQFESTLHPDGCMAHARYFRGGGVFFQNFQGEFQEYLNTVWEVDDQGNKVRDMEEGLWGEPTVLVDHEMATVWTPFWYRVNGNLSHVGTNSFGLLKVYKHENGNESKEGKGKGTWKIVVAHDTGRIPTEDEVSEAL
jgi:hypothetical protein